MKPAARRWTVMAAALGAVLSASAAPALDVDVLKEVAKEAADRVFIVPKETPDGKAALPEKKHGKQVGGSSEPPAQVVDVDEAWPVSLMFSTTDMRRLRSVLAALAEGAGEDQEVAVAEEEFELEEGLKKELVYPSFKLRSLIYRSPSNWAARINDADFSNESGLENGELTLAHIDEDQVNVVWKPAEGALFTAIAQKLATQAAPEIAHRAAHGDAPPQVDAQNKAIAFTLHINQTFDTKAFTVYEGQPQGASAAAVEDDAAINAILGEEQAATPEGAAGAPAAPPGAPAAVGDTDKAIDAILGEGMQNAPASGSATPGQITIPLPIKPE